MILDEEHRIQTASSQKTTETGKWHTFERVKKISYLGITITNNNNEEAEFL